jgi:RNA polymerase sigma factor (sigma-70 family)
LTPERFARGAAVAAAARGWGDYDDLFSAALAAVVKADERYAPERHGDIPLDKWRDLCAWRAMYRVMRRFTARARPVACDRMASRPDERAEAPVSALLRAEFWDRATAGLTTNQRAAVLLVHRDGLTQAEAAARLGKSEAAVKQTLDRAAKHVRRNLREFSPC